MEENALHEPDSSHMDTNLKCAWQLSVVRECKLPCNLLANLLWSLEREMAGGQDHARP